MHTAWATIASSEKTFVIDAANWSLLLGRCSHALEGAFPNPLVFALINSTRATSCHLAAQRLMAMGQLHLRSKNAQEHPTLAATPSIQELQVHLDVATSPSANLGRATEPASNQVDAPSQAAVIQQSKSQFREESLNKIRVQQLSAALEKLHSRLSN
ncbi:hypothetical protein BC831DRAFT_236428 [Entophlyctis helioformis]|nr:hypothetical protein BC831DRAFT_236428 [Entophlyctis helioformis]